MLLRYIAYIFKNYYILIFISIPVRTSANFYRRGVPNSFINFAKIASGNYTVGQPTGLKINSNFFQSQFNAAINQRT
jgi:hypothetical protein